MNDKWNPKGTAKIGKPYDIVSVLRSVLTSSEAMSAIAQVPLGAHEGESAAFGRMVESLHKAYGRSVMIEIIHADAVLTSPDNADAVDRPDYGYGFGLLRLMAYKLVQHLRKRRLRGRDEIGALEPPMCWRTLFKRIRQALENATAEPVMVGPGV